MPLVGRKGGGAQEAIWGLLFCLLIWVLGTQVYSVGDDKSSDILMICVLFCICIFYRKFFKNALWSGHSRPSGKWSWLQGPYV